VLLQPLEEEFDLPAALVELGDGQRREREVVREEDELAAAFRVEVANPAEAFGVALLAVETVEPDELIRGHPGRPIDRLRVEVPEPKVPLGPRHEEAVILAEPVQPSEVEVGAVEDVDGPGLDL